MAQILAAIMLAISAFVAREVKRKIFELSITIVTYIAGKEAAQYLQIDLTDILDNFLYDTEEYLKRVIPLQMDALGINKLICDEVKKQTGFELNPAEPLTSASFTEAINKRIGTNLTDISNPDSTKNELCNFALTEVVSYGLVERGLANPIAYTGGFDKSAAIAWVGELGGNILTTQLNNQGVDGTINSLLPPEQAIDQIIDIAGNWLIQYVSEIAESQIAGE